MQSTMQSFLRDESGVTAIEYGILAAAMAAAISVIFGADGAFVRALTDRFEQIAEQIRGSAGGTDSAAPPATGG